MVEHHVANVVVAGSSPVPRSKAVNSSAFAKTRSLYVVEREECAYFRCDVTEAVKGG